MYTAIVFLPLIGFLIAGIFGRQLGPRPSELITTILLFIAAAFVAIFETGLSPRTLSITTSNQGAAGRRTRARTQREPAAEPALKRFKHVKS